MEPIYFHRYKLQTDRPLNSRSERHGISGALLRQGDGFGCLQPWPELGDDPLDEHLQRLSSGEQSALVQRALECCAIDGRARRAGISLFVGLSVPQSHATLVGFPNLSDLEALAAGGFEAVKIKISSSALAKLAAWKTVPLKIRLDANGTLMPEEFLAAMHSLTDDVREAIDFVEDACVYDAEVWNFLRARSGVELALDRGNVRENVGVVVLDVIDYQGVWAVMYKLGALVKKCRVVLVCLDDKIVGIPQPRRRTEIGWNSANQKTRGARPGAAALGLVRAPMDRSHPPL